MKGSSISNARIVQYDATGMSRTGSSGSCHSFIHSVHHSRMVAAAPASTSLTPALAGTITDGMTLIMTFMLLVFIYAALLVANPGPTPRAVSVPDDKTYPSQTILLYLVAFENNVKNVLFPNGTLGDICADAVDRHECADSFLEARQNVTLARLERLLEHERQRDALVARIGELETQLQTQTRPRLPTLSLIEALDAVGDAVNHLVLAAMLVMHGMLQCLVAVFTGNIV